MHMSLSSPQPVPADTIVIPLDRIRACLDNVAVVDRIAEGFAAYSQGKANIPPVGELLLPDGECHIKYGTIAGSPYYVVKVASGFGNNQRFGLPGGNGLVLLFDSLSGKPLAVILDQGYLTDVRTAAAGALCATWLGPAEVQAIGIVGSGAQARFQAEYLRRTTSCRTVWCWAQSKEKAAGLKNDLTELGFDVTPTDDLSKMMARCQWVVTTTRSQEALILPEHLHPGLHITAVGSDTPDKQELHPEVIQQADLVFVDSREQCAFRGETYQAVRAGVFNLDDAVEIGEVVNGSRPGRTTATQITVADLTGVAVQDLQIAAAVYESILAEGD